MKRKRSIAKRIIASVIALAVIAAGVLYVTGFFGTKTAEAASETYQVVSLETGDLKESVTGTGTLSAGDSENVTAPIALTVDEVKVEAGQSVKKGDTLATLDKEALDSTIASLQSQIESLDSQLASLLKQQDSTVSVTSNIAGRVKQILVKAGSDVKTTVEQKGGLILLSTDGYMRLDLALGKAGAVKAGDEVTVKTSGSSYDGTVTSVGEDKASCTVTLTDNGPKLNASATVYYGGKKIGSGKLTVNQPIYVTATSGIVDEVNVSLNQKVSTRKKLLYLYNVGYSESYSAAADQRAEYSEQLKQALLLRKACTLTAETDGVINEITAKDAAALEKDAAVLTMYTGGATNLSVSVDELDISKVKEGLKVTVAMDAITDKTYEGTVTAVSQVGTTSNGVTTYPVTVKVTDDGNLKIGMSATATIIIQEKTDVLLVPISAIQTSQGESYVWVYSGALPEDSKQDPGVKTAITYGLSDSDYAEVTSGLTADDQVVIVRTKSASSSTGSSKSSGQQSGMDLGGMMGGMPPDAGRMGG
jgi:HlyD family secretion protein